MNMLVWIDEGERLWKEVEEAMRLAGIESFEFDKSEAVKFLLACQQNNVDIWRAYSTENLIENRRLHVNHNPPILQEETRV